MSILYIDNALFYRMLISGANNLENNKQYVNSLNVFPVPDGDTGTNMSLTMTSAIREVQKSQGESVEVIAEAASNGSLMGARGNSGVILSQILRGLARGLKGKDSIDAKALAASFKEGVNTAYKAVMKPTEGTILTVAREAADKAIELSKNINDIVLFMDKVCQHAKLTLDRTPDMLPVLKQAGVVDAGGKGLLFIYEGMLSALNDNDISAGKEVSPKEEEQHFEGHLSEEEIKFGYCTEFIIKTSYDDVDKFKGNISSFGDSLVVVGGTDIIKVHIHTNNPGNVLTEALSLGELINIKIDNMREQHKNVLGLEKKDADADAAVDINNSPKKAGIITVAMGSGIKNIFLDLGADKVIEGGQTMNPSTEDILKAVNEVNAEDIYILPNNGNIVMAAKQAASLSNKNVVVIPTKSIPQGIAALTVFNPESSSNQNEEIMTTNIGYVKTGQVTYAVRNTSYNDISINEGDILGIKDGKINNIGRDIISVSETLIENMMTEEDELVTIFYGSDISEEDAEKLVEKVQARNGNCDVQLYYGGQPLYYFIISVE